jgi:hypothetical protein
VHYTTLNTVLILSSIISIVALSMTYNRSSATIVSSLSTRLHDFTRYKKNVEKIEFNCKVKKNDDTIYFLLGDDPHVNERQNLLNLQKKTRSCL